ncbi:MAG: hypothetical protein K0S01_2882 [Herbinix sp.]|jgi:hypothetical protein|nr:hypothetical protein [Herbinix sp.]
MGEQFYLSGKPSGFQYEKQNDFVQGNPNSNEINRKQKELDRDLIIEENTVYEIDRECYERLKRQKKRK